MALAVLYEAVGLTQEQYDKIIELLQRGGKTADGRIYHVAGPVEGGMRVCDVWESQRAFETFIQEKLVPVIQELGATPPQIKPFPVHNMLSGPENHL